MVRSSRSLDVLLSEFNALRASLAPHTRDLQKLNEDRATHRSALRQLRVMGQSEDNAEQSKLEQTIYATKSNSSKCKRLRNLENKIKRRMKAEAPARLFLIVAHMLTGVKVGQSSFDDFMEVAECDYVSSHLEQVLMRNNKHFCFRDAWAKLEPAIEYCDDHVDCSKILHYDLLKNEFNVMRTLADLHGILREKLTNYFYGFMVKCEKLHIFENDGFGYTYGSAHDSLQDRAFSFPEHACVIILHDQLSDTCEHARMEDALSALLREHDQEILKNSLVALATLGICQYKDMVATRGPNNFAENERWLTHEFLVDLLCVAPEDVDETDDGSHRQCDSCKCEQ